MFDELRELFRGLATMTAASMRATQAQHDDAMSRSHVGEALKREEMERDRAARERQHVLSEREVVAWERIATALEQLAEKT